MICNHGFGTNLHPSLSLFPRDHPFVIFTTTAYHSGVHLNFLMNIDRRLFEARPRSQNGLRRPIQAAAVTLQRYTPTSGVALSHLLGRVPATLLIVAQPCPTNLVIILIVSPSLLRIFATCSTLSVHRRMMKSRRRSNTGSNSSSPNHSRLLTTLRNESRPWHGGIVVPN